MVDSAVIEHTIAEKFEAARGAARTLSTITTSQKNAALAAIARDVVANMADIIAANARDLERGKSNGMAEGLQERLRLTPDRIEQLSVAVRDIIELADPVGVVARGSVLPNGLAVSQVRVPFGVIGAIYEARPNVTIDIAALALKSGNAVILRGGSAAEESNRVLVAIIQSALASVGIVPTAVQTIDEFGRDGAKALMQARGFVDVLIPRGSAQLIRTVVQESTVPVIETGSGIVHVFLDESADTAIAIDIVHNAKVQRPSVCNALETLLVHEAAAERLIPVVLARLAESGVTIHADERTRQLFPQALVASEEVWSTEHLGLEIGVRVVSDLDAAIDHITTFSTKHTESIITNDLTNADRFLAEVDSAVVMVNASTRFTDGAEFGFGAEVGISTQKLHARGPMGLPELTSTKWVVRGSGQVRG
ncbi:glutamate-5-semialdehyde dehydrogenase [Salinibacterium sp. M195]|uniref:glutamate-5-semialdehyde dehydrogenase n=1 Tax=Salinibacterium sp. M195 TaxID=2583374 RepID=UPI001C636652|nr:glutamate-5-semialdehyde dehydrogenase [Salinibacterium sp. M195]QYH35898.1 glutamate-5-semialdehyde dehydrogenase [Salinibacterium sp. M195]